MSLLVLRIPKKKNGECEMKKTIGLIAIAALVCVAAGCDRSKHEPENKVVPKAAVKTNQDVNRLPFKEAIEKCKEDEFYASACLANHGWVVTKEQTDNNWRDSYWEENKY